MIKRLLFALAAMASIGTALSAEVGSYPNAAAITGPERLLADQGGITVNLTPAQLATYINALTATVTNKTVTDISNNVGPKAGGALDGSLYIMALQNGALFNDVHDDGPALQLALNACSVSNVCQADFPPGLTAALNTGITITTGLAGFNGDHLTLDAQGMTTGCITVGSGCYAIEVIGNGNSPFADLANVSPIENIRLIGPSFSSPNLSNNLDGIYMGAPTGSTCVCNQTFRNIQIKGFRDGLYFGNDVYIDYFYALDLENSWRYGINAGGSTNTGENLFFLGGSISANNSVSKSSASGSSIAVYMPGNASFEFHFVGTSFDYNDQIYSILTGGGQFDCESCHLEDSHYNNVMGSQVWTSGNPVVVKLTDGSVSLGESGANSRTSIFTVNGAYAQFTADTHWVTYNHSSQWVASSNNSAVSIQGSTIFGQSGATFLPDPGNATNLLYNPGFETSNANGWVTAGGTWSTVTSPVHSGTYAEQTVGTGTTTSIAQQFVPVRAGQTIIARCYVDITAYTSGQTYLRLGYYAANSTSSQISTINTTPLVATTGGYVLQYYQGVVPQGITTVVFYEYGPSFSGTFVVDDCEMQVF